MVCCRAPDVLWKQLEADRGAFACADRIRVLEQLAWISVALVQVYIFQLFGAVGKAALVVVQLVVHGYGTDVVKQTAEQIGAGALAGENNELCTGTAQTKTLKGQWSIKYYLALQKAPCCNAGHKKSQVHLACCRIPNNQH